MGAADFRRLNWTEIGRRLALARSLSARTLDQAAFRCGISAEFLARLEAGRESLPDLQLSQLAASYQATLEWTVGLVPEQVNDPQADRHPDPQTRERLRTILAMRRTNPTQPPPRPRFPRNITA